MKKLHGAACTVIFIYSNAAMAVSFTPLGDLAGSDFFSEAYGVSDDGSVVVGVSNSAASGCEPFRWTSGGGMVGLGHLVEGVFMGGCGGEPTHVGGVSGDGSVVVGGESINGYTAYRWTSAGGMVGLGDLPGGSFHSQAEGVSGDGSVAVGISASASGFEAFRWTSAGGMVGLGDLAGSGFLSAAYGVSDDGSVVVGYGDTALGYEAYRWTSAGGMVGLGDLPGGHFFSGAYGVSSNGSVVVGNSVSASGPEAFRWTSAGGMVGLGDLLGGGFESTAYGVSDDGSVVVGTGTTALGNEAFRWTSASGIQSVASILTTIGIGLTGWTLQSATEISADGNTIVGYGINPDGFTEAWIANLSDIPQTFSDVPYYYWAYSHIESLADSGITSGCGDGNYCPDGLVTRAQMAVFLERGMRGSGYNPGSGVGNIFMDVPASYWAGGWIELLFSDGITSGCGNNNYCPGSSTTRAQMAVFLLRAKHGQDYAPPTPVGVFNDVPLTNQYAGWIEQLASEGITGGCGNGNYCPNDSVTRAQMAVFLVRTFGL